MSKIKNIDADNAWELLKNNINSFLIDVRTEPEWQFIGIPDLSEINKRMFALSWNIYPHMAINSDFLEQLQRSLNEEGSNDPQGADLVFICRSGVRSMAAAEFCHDRGFSNCYNLNNGFEGPVDGNGHRGTIDGWKARNLPWRQM